MVRKGNLSFLTVVPAFACLSRVYAPQKLVFPSAKRENKCWSETNELFQEKIVNRTFAVLGIVALGTSLAIAGAAFAQSKTSKKAPAKADAAAVARGKDLFQQKCST